MFPFKSLQEPDSAERMQTLINTMKTVKQEEPPQVVNDPGPASSFFNYEEEKQRLEKSQEERNEMNARLAKGNALIDGFRLLTQGVGMELGSSVPKENPNPHIIGAYNDYQKLDDDMRDRLDRFRMLDLNNLTREAQNAYQDKARGETFEHQKGMADQTYDRTLERDQMNKEHDLDMLDQRQGGVLEAQKKKGEQDLRLEQQRAALGHYSYQNRGYGAGGRNSYNLRGVEISPDLQAKMLHALQQKYSGDSMKPRALKSIDHNENIQDESVRDLFMEEWDYLTETIPELTGRAAKSEIFNAPQEEDGQQWEVSDERLVAGLKNIFDNTSFRPNQKERKIKKWLMDARGMTKDEAEEAYFEYKKLYGQ